MSKKLTAKEYLQQAFRINERISAGRVELERTRELAFSAGAPLHDVGAKPPKNAISDKVGVNVARIVDLETEINAEIDALVALKTEIRGRIAEIEQDDLRLILQKRYFNFEKWEQIAVDLDLTIRAVYFMHGRALKKFSEKFALLH